MASSSLAIVNPVSDSGTTGRHWSQLESMLRARLGSIDVAFTTGPNDAQQIAQRAALAGVERLIVVGGDGTAREVVSGLLTAERSERIEVTILPFGTGCDFARGLGIPSDPRSAIDALERGKKRRVDAGRITCVDGHGQQTTTHFVNVASLGLSGSVVRTSQHLPHWLSGRSSYLLATLLCAATYRANSVRIRVDDREIFAGPLLLAAIANGNYFGGGMRIAPDAHCDDGLFDVVLIRELSKAELLKNVGSLYRGTHIEHPAVSVHRGQRVEVEPLDSRPAQLDIDGDPLGQVPAQIEILPRAISLLGGNAL